MEEMWRSCPPRLQPVGELRQRPLVVDHAQLPDITPDLRLVFVRLTNVRISGDKKKKKKENKERDEHNKNVCRDAGTLSM